MIEQGTLAAYKEDGVEKYKILATLDSKTSEICRDEDGRVYLISEWNTGINAPPYHPFCRTTTVPFYDDEDYSDDTRAARDPVTGKTYKVPADMRYRHWHDKYVTGKTKSEYDDIIGIQTSNGIKMTSVSKHAIDRAIGRNVAADSAKEALLNPLKVSKIRIDDKGLPSQKYIGEKATCSINPDTGLLIQVNPTSLKYAKSLKKRRVKGADI